MDVSHRNKLPNMIRLSIRILSGIAVIIGGTWIIFSPGFDSILTCIGGLIAFLGSFANAHLGNDSGPNIHLSTRAKTLLEEIDSSKESSMKGISLMMVDSITGFYLPYIWNNGQHGAIQTQVSDIGDVVVTVGELEKNGFLVLHSQPSKALSQYRRTEKMWDVMSERITN
jgi:hypothetical protein